MVIYANFSPPPAQIKPFIISSLLKQVVSKVDA